ncbi:MAG: TIGR04283 family arsenosugar biosynthesis glycosyltransferase [Rhodobiaceae bacterium]|nr:TIGR04283 family arsenosugar biosynthesis glycosyltransferase [Rhodobiaceae bacterium]MCC0054816.1 TIGR04283 family arsenosugar biosynthesis glycosyltransferase [Rhodobiaceae bacterium]
MLSVVIPTLNVAASLPSVLMALYEPALDGLVRQVVIADGGSTDPTLKVADDAGCDVVSARPGRGIQLATGARKARADWLLFLHADTVLQPGWEAEVLRFINRHGPEKAAAFRFSLDDDRLRARLLEWAVSLRVHLFALPYGDQGLLISRRLYERIGGFSDVPIMEDVDIVRRIGRRRLKRLNTKALTSAERYVQNGYIRRVVRNLGCLVLYSLGFSPDLIRRVYG